MAEVIRRWQFFAVSLGFLWAGYLAFDLVPPVVVGVNGLYLIDARFLGKAVPSCLATDDALGCFGLVVHRLNTMEVYCRAAVVLLSCTTVYRLHNRMVQRYVQMGVFDAESDH